MALTQTWTLVACGALVLAGSVLLLRANALMWRIRTVSPGPDLRVRQLQFFARAFRVFVVGLGMVGVAMGWLHDLGWLVTLSIVFGLEELYEGTAILGILRRTEKDNAKARRRSATACASSSSAFRPPAYPAGLPRFRRRRSAGW